MPGGWCPVAGARWLEFEGLDGPEPFWRIPKERMKGKEGERYAHLVPLARQTVEILAAIKRLTGGRGYVFGHAWDTTVGMSIDTLGALLRRSSMAGKHVPHGWRSAFSTVMNGLHRADREVIDLMLAHRRGNKVEAAYNRAAYMDWRRELAQEWANLLMEGKGTGADLILRHRHIGNERIIGFGEARPPEGVEAAWIWPAAAPRATPECRRRATAPAPRPG